MNLYDLAGRQDRMLDVESGALHATVLKGGEVTRRAVGLADQSRVRLRGAHLATCMRVLPEDPGWTAVLGAGARLQVWLESEGHAPWLLCETEPMRVVRTTPANRPARGLSRLLAGMRGGSPASAPAPDDRSECELRFRWPLRMPAAYDLVLIAHGEASVAVGPLRDSRAGVIPLLRGNGLEVGPGANPALVDDEHRRMTYIERLRAEDWARLYPKQPLPEPVRARWADYRIGPAEDLHGIPEASQDFIFSNHVLEHLVNPLQVLLNWWKRLRPEGLLACVVPDARYSFDLRQPLTTAEEFRRQYSMGGQARTPAMYARWRELTTPESDIDSLRARDYAIHVNYFSPVSLRCMLDLASDLLDVRPGIFIDAHRNGRDFAFVMTKPL